MSGTIYIIAADGIDAVKIGYTRGCPYARCGSLQTGCPRDLAVLLCWPGTQAEERRLHETFKEYRLRGEWFTLTGALQDFIWYLQDATAPEPPEIEHDREAFVSVIRDVIAYPIGPWAVPQPINRDIWREVRA